MAGRQQHSNNIRPMNPAGDQFIRVNSEAQMRHAKRVHARRRTGIYMMTMFVIIGFFVTGIGNYNRMHQAEAQTVKLNKQVKKAQTENKELKVTKNNLKDDKYAEQYVRQRYLYTKKGEVVFNLPDNNK
ncbi:septum formation initiator family protein [Weissella diestrammenae]|uniref:Septum formation initiator family protein n=1 Tax=Weissella diestrammenae TaxID=1162633 RepID=A0A7G9T7E0_9LACO|nr:septum formation initiator family protein [Weissella diestrammenae]MCM0582029.1 septum formation initiator family protein [Weissella diestrammenae]QNN76015.1 septum formation initiator family protein [Weissella diestrammenae]